MEDRAIALGGLVATPISIGIVAGAVITYILLMRYWRKQDGEK